MKKPLTRSELEALHSVLLRAAERAERHKLDREAARLWNELSDIEVELTEGVRAQLRNEPRDE